MEKNFLGIQNPSKDTHTQRFSNDTRKPKLTLATLNKLKKIRANRKLNLMARRQIMQSMYGIPEESI